MKFSKWFGNKTKSMELDKVASEVEQNNIKETTEEATMESTNDEVKSLIEHNITQIVSDHNFAELMCFLDREGFSLSRISEVTLWEEQDIQAVLEEAKEQGVYNELADNVKEYCEGVFTK